MQIRNLLIFYLVIQNFKTIIYNRLGIGFNDLFSQTALSMDKSISPHFQLLRLAGLFFNLFQAFRYHNSYTWLSYIIVSNIFMIHGSY